jgi:hypothetical protein
MAFRHKHKYKTFVLTFFEKWFIVLLEAVMADEVSKTQGDDRTGQWSDVVKISAAGRNVQEELRSNL